MARSHPPESLAVGLFTNAYRPLISGVINCIDLARRELLRQGHRPYLFAPRVAGYRGGPAGVFRFPSVNVTPQVKFPLPIPISCPIFLKMARMGLQVVHTHHPYLLGDLAYAWARWHRIPLVFTFHTQYEEYSHYVPLYQPFIKALTRWGVVRFATRCDLIIAPSPVIADVLRDLGLKTWTVTLQNAVDLGQFQDVTSAARRTTRLRLGIPEEAVLALYAGRIAKEKNLDFLLRSFVPVARHQPRAHLLVVGDGPVLAGTQQLARDLGLSGRVTFAGRVDYQEMPTYYGCADFFAMASVTEVKPLVVLEALASGLPVVAIAACGTADTVTHERDGLLCSHEAEALTAIWRRAVTEDRRPWAARARETAASYSIGPYTRRLVELYAEARERIRSSI